MADDTLRDRAIEALLPFFGDGVFGIPEFQAGRMADAVLALVEAHTRQAQAEALRAVVEARAITIPDVLGYKVRAVAVEDVLTFADELDPKGDGQ